MGVKGLWTILNPYCEKKPLYEIRGEKVAIDLSGWVCDSQNVADQHVQPRLYLRNLFFRTSYLLSENITPIFVLEGEAPLSKCNTMINRNLIQFKSCKTNTKKVQKPDRNRKRFRSVLIQCEKLLKSMGLECVQGVGEAEAMCAYLNSIGLVTAVVSQDSDCFVYGAKRVYRNFSISNSGCNSTNFGSVDIYDMDNIRKFLDFGRNKMVALALLCGSDYNANGIEGIGQANAVSFLSQHADEVVLQRLESWFSNPKLFEKMDKDISDPKRCAGCGHFGNIRSHLRSGCLDCKTTVSCDQTSYRNQKDSIKLEINIRKKVMQSDVAFPNKDIIDEYLINKEIIPDGFKPHWKKPDLIKFVKLMTSSLGWTEYYCIEKFLPLLTRWQLLYISRDTPVAENEKMVLHINAKSENLTIIPAHIKKVRNPKGVACYEVVWKDNLAYYEGLVPDEQFDENGTERLWTTIERQDLMQIAYSDVVEAFLSSKNNKKKKSKAQKALKSNKPKPQKVSKMDHNLTKLDDSMRNLSIADEICNAKDTRKRKSSILEVSFKTKRKKFRVTSQKRKLNRSQKLLDTYFNVVKNLSALNNSQCIGLQENNLSKVNSELINMNNITNCEFSEENLSAIVDDIIKRKNNYNVGNFLMNMKECKDLTPIKSASFKTHETINNKIEAEFSSTPIKKASRRTSTFFGPLENDNDLFEMSVNSKSIKNKSRKSSLIPYTPLLERIKKLDRLN